MRDATETTLVDGGVTSSRSSGSAKNPLARRAAAALFSVSIALALGATVGADTARAARAIDPAFFGQHLGNFQDPRTLVAPVPWQPKAIRLHNSAVAWCDLNPAPGVYRWDRLDRWMNYAATQGADLLYTFSRPPGWALDRAGGCETSSESRLPSRSAWRQFVAELVRHADGRIRYFELWNEWDASWPGTTAQMAAYARGAAKTLHGAGQGLRVLNPSSTSTDSAYGDKLESLLRELPPSSGVIDVVAVHSYFTNSNRGGAWPEFNYPECRRDVRPLGTLCAVRRTRAVMERTGYGGHPLWSTEGGWGRNRLWREYASPTAQRAFVARYGLGLLSQGIERAYWYAFAEPAWGTLWDAPRPAAPGGLGPGGLAMRELVRTEGWLDGATLTAPCSAGPTGVWSCHLTRPDDTQARVLWIDDGTQTVPAPPGATRLRRLDGTSATVGSRLTLYPEPVLVESNSRPGWPWRGPVLPGVIAIGSIALIGALVVRGRRRRAQRSANAEPPSS